MRKKVAFDVQAAILEAWDMIWRDKLAQRAKDERAAKRTGRTGYRDDRTYYTTASDVENQVRQFAIEQSKGLKRGSMGIAWGKPSSWPTVRIHLSRGGNLFGVVRDWLLAEVRHGRVDSHNFGRHHISGMRFRPHGAPLSEAEKKTIARNERQRAHPKPRPCHYSASGYGGRPMCTSPLAGRYRQSKAWTTKDKDKVTCPRCTKRLATMKAEEVAA